uniref:DUF281 domain-containing protein n=1 Tax=Caenorhabditis tropicalis TaxID=1561998 RepID=A0A1I7TUQ7_9PELO
MFLEDYNDYYHDYYPTVPQTKMPTVRPATTAPVTTARAACTSCNINAIAPPSNPPGTNFETTALAPAGGCTQAQVTCMRTDDQYCTGVSITATTPTGDSTISNTTGTSVLSSSATLTYEIGGTYSFGTAMQISQLTCVFTGCYPPSCSSCDVNRIAPTTLPAGTEFTFT